MRHCYSEQEGDWIDTVCRAMNRWAMAANEVEAAERLWAGHPARLDATVADDTPIRVDSIPEPASRPARRSNRASVTRLSDRSGLTAGI